MAGWRLTLPSAAERFIQLDHGGELVPRGRGEVQLRELALGIEHLKLGGESPVVAESGQRERPAGRCHAALTLRTDLPHFPVEDQSILDLAERLLDRLQILCGRLLLACLEALTVLLVRPAVKRGTVMVGPIDQSRDPPIDRRVDHCPGGDAIGWLCEQP